ncbi:MAG: alpha/beta fold hydrolase [Alphaproteobacteria bacterium]
MPPASEPSFFSLPDGQLEYAWAGAAAPNSRALVFLHHALGSVTTWRDFPQRLADATGLPAFNYSRLGHGKSDPANPNRALDYLDHEAFDVLPRVLEMAGIAEPILVGHSDGATIALLHASMPASPTLAIVVEAPHIFVEDRTVAGIEATAIEYKTTKLRERLMRHHGDNTDDVFAAWADTWRKPAFRTWNCEHRLPAIRCPTLLVQGIDDEYGTPLQVERIRDQVSGLCEMALIPACGHFPHQEKPDETLAVITRFIVAMSRG